MTSWSELMARPTCAPDAADAGYRPQFPARGGGDPVHLRQRGTRDGPQLQQQVAVLQRGQQRAAADLGHAGQRGDGEHPGERPGAPGPADRARQPAIEEALHGAAERPLTAHVVPAQQQHGEGRGQGERHQHRREQRQRVGEHQRAAEGGGERAEEQERRQRQQDCQRGVHERPARRGERLDHRAAALIGPRALGPGPVAVRRLRAGTAQPQAGRIQVGDHVIDHQAQGGGKPEQRNGGQSCAGQEQDTDRHHERYRHHDQGDDRRPPGREQQQHEHERGGERDQRDHPRVAQRRLDVAGRAVDVRVDRDALQPRGHLLQRGLDAPGDLKGVRAGELVDGEQQLPGVRGDGVPDERLVVLHHGGHVAEPQKMLPWPFDRDLGELRRVGDRGDVLDGEALVG